VRTAGSVLFDPATGGHGTVVRVSMEVSPPGAGLGRALGKALSPDTAQQVREDLGRFKRLMETGEVPLADGGISGARPAPAGKPPLTA
jgi:uncharacterized membrane protein